MNLPVEVKLRTEVPILTMVTVIAGGGETV